MRPANPPVEVEGGSWIHGTPVLEERSLDEPDVVGIRIPWEIGGCGTEGDEVEGGSLGRALNPQVGRGVEPDGVAGATRHGRVPAKVKRMGAQVHLGPLHIGVEGEFPDAAPSECGP